MAIKEKGVGSLVWYLKAIKVNQPNSGINFLTKYKGIDWYSADEAVKTLIGRGMILAKGKPESKRKSYEVTSFGHRYLEEHKDELEGIEPTPGGPQPIKMGPEEPGTGRALKPSEDPARTAAPGLGVQHIVPRNPGLIRSISAAPENDPEEYSVGPTPEKFTTPESSPAPEQRPDTPSGLESPKPAESSPPAPTPEPIQKPAESPILDTPSDFVTQLRTIAGELALDKFADQITVKDLLDHAEAKS